MVVSVVYIATGGVKAIVWTNVFQSLMFLMNLTLIVLSEMKVLTFGWSWLVVLGTIGTMLLALIFSATARRGSPRPS